MRHFPAPLGQPEMMRKNFMRSGICLYSWCTVPRMKFVFCLSARGVQFGFLLKLFAWKGKVSGMSTKFVFVTGGVVSGLGKGICAASLGRLLKQRGVRVRNQKFDPYINVDPGTMSPYQHGEVFVTEDGAETDLDLGHYERFVDEDLTGNSSVSSGKIYWSVLNRERRGDYLGATVQIIPHITDEIKRRIYAMAEEDVDVVITEIGGTVGDIESQPFLEAIRQGAAERLAGCSGILVPGGFGDRGIEGMIAAVRYARERCIPYFGICLGMQMAVIEFARHVLGWADASSSEFSSTAHPVIDLMPDQVNVTAKGGTMRLGRYPCVLAEGSRSRELYGAAEISERHRHRYEFNNDFRAEMQVGGMRLAGLSPDGRLVEIIELPDHPWFVGAQFHPEFKSRPDRPHPLFYGFVKASVEKMEADT